ncbi:hypothetical protein [Novosphingobium album (ex Liu et al. 2023)]|uniref:Uncharacterized protein n=1 Tax=Novosphingobium album (ex Liu et al. 2023) TaxID=3031130 RepID=A0ABT5WXZ3_9SPHN|nr:hypothetical protein [Novosphingobium album (ex Liu et al. 2023)]MDE8654767.1 hypothetical protein [Novosphingobium album (ex Liu et al. 2023)]
MTASPTWAVENGRRAEVTFGPVTRVAGIRDRPDGTMTIAFMADSARLRDPKTGTVAGEPVTVLSIKASDPKTGGVAGMVLITARAMGAE